MRKRSKYRPRAKYADPVGFVLEGLKPLAKHESYLIDLRLKNHAAFAMLTRGEATKETMAVLLAMNNVTSALCHLSVGEEYSDVLAAGGEALIAVGRRGLATGRFILKGPELVALNALMDLHDAQMDAINVKKMDDALAYIEKLERAKQYTRIAA